MPRHLRAAVRKTLAISSRAAGLPTRRAERAAFTAILLRRRDIWRAVHGVIDRAGVMDEIHPHDIGTILDREGVAIRTGHHCAQPVMTRYGLPATARASLGLYNTREDLDALAKGLGKVREVFG